MSPSVADCLERRMSESFEVHPFGEDLIRERVIYVQPGRALLQELPVVCGAGLGRQVAALTRGREATTVEDRGTMEDAVFDAVAVFLLRQEVSPDGAAQAEAAHGTFDRDVVCRRFALNNEDGSRRWKKALVAAEPGAQGEGALLRQRRRAGAPAWRRG